MTAWWALPKTHFVRCGYFAFLRKAQYDGNPSLRGLILSSRIIHEKPLRVLWILRLFYKKAQYDGIVIARFYEVKSCRSPKKIQINLQTISKNPQNSQKIRINLQKIKKFTQKPKFVILRVARNLCSKNPRKFTKFLHFFTILKIP